MLDVIKNYDFWGHCDIDLVFGDIRKFITDDILNYYDKIFFRGHLSLYRNIEKMNNLFKLNYSGNNFKKVFTNEKIYGFDEWNGIYKICNENDIKSYNKNVIVDVSIKYKFIFAIHVYNI